MKVLYSLFIPIMLICFYILMMAFCQTTPFYSAWTLTIGMTLIVASNWILTDRGRNPSFLFLIALTIFLAGRAFTVVFSPQDPQIIVVPFGQEFDVSQTTLDQYVLIVLTSGLLVHLGSLSTRFRSTTLTLSPLDRKIYLLLFVVSLPLYMYKNLYYLFYLMAHGSYLAIYTGTEHIEGAGIIPRLGALLFTASFVMYFFHEPNKNRAKRWLIIFFIAFSTELLIGLRGKFFTTALTIALFYHLRFGGNFRARWMGIMALIVIVLSVFIGIFRTQGQESLLSNNILETFLNLQGVSSGVLLTILEFPELFAGKGLSYFWNQFLVPFVPQAMASQKSFLSNDVSIFLMPKAVEVGFGTASSYLAEFYLLGGWVTIVLGSLLIGLFLSRAKNVYDGLRGCVMFWIVAGIIYYPRTMLHEPIHNLIKYGPVTLALVLTTQAARAIRSQKS